MAVGTMAESSRFANFQRWVGKNQAPLLLVALAIIIPEVLTGSTPVWNLINPLAVLGLLGFYGCGVILIRELSIRWGNGWAGILPLGFAYGVAEEGIATKTMVDPKSSAAGPYLGSFGHFLGINWVFAVAIVLFHVVFSISLPILIVGLKYPTTRGQRWLSDRGTLVTLFLLAISVTIGFFGFDPHYFEGYAVLLFLLGVLAGFVIVARIARREWLVPRTLHPRNSPAWFLGLGVACAFGWLIFYLPGPYVIRVPVLDILGQIGTLVTGLYVLRERVGREQNELHLVYFAAGLLSWYFLWDFIISFIALDFLVWIFLGGVYWILYRLKVRYATVPTLPPALPT